MTGRVSVLHIITKLELGGAQKVAIHLVTHLNPMLFDTGLLVGEPGLLDEAAQAQIPRFYRIPALVRPFHLIQDCRAVFQLTSLLKRLRPTIVHTHSSKAGIVGRIAAWLAKVPIVVHTVHGFGVTPEQPRYMQKGLLFLERLAARVSSKVFCVSEANCRQGIQIGLFERARTAIIRPGVDLEAIRAVSVDRVTKCQELGLDPTKPVVGMVGPLKPQKAPLDFVRMASAILKIRPDVQFVYVGDGALRSVVEREIEAQGLGKVFHLLGWRQDVWEILRCLTVFVLTSRWEGLPCVYVEARTSGVPVVGTRVDGADEIIQDGVHGFLVEPGDVQALAERVLQIVSDPLLAKTISVATIDVPGEFGVQEMVRRQEEEYLALLRGLARGKSLESK
jgi:glycosyltransferase involved in cell wall biosynthesis